MPGCSLRLQKCLLTILQSWQLLARADSTPRDKRWISLVWCRHEGIKLGLQSCLAGCQSSNKKVLTKLLQCNDMIITSLIPCQWLQYSVYQSNDTLFMSNTNHWRKKTVNAVFHCKKYNLFYCIFLLYLWFFCHFALVFFCLFKLSLTPLVVVKYLTCSDKPSYTSTILPLFPVFLSPSVRLWKWLYLKLFMWWVTFSL